jgi:hypothetical protein
MKKIMIYLLIIVFLLFPVAVLADMDNPFTALGGAVDEQQSKSQDQQGQIDKQQDQVNKQKNQIKDQQGQMGTQQDQIGGQQYQLNDLTGRTEYLEDTLIPRCRDGDRDGHYAQADCGTDVDCDDNDPLWFKSVEGKCAVLSGYTQCDHDSVYEKQCHPVISDVQGKLQDLDIDVNKDKFEWPDGYARPGGWPNPKKRHLQAIQYFDCQFGTEQKRCLAVPMGDEHHTCVIEGGSPVIDPANPCHLASINIVKTARFGSEKDGLDRVVYQKFLVEDDEVAGYNHPGGAQRIGDYLLVALEDFITHGRPKTGVWKINRIVASGQDPFLSFKYSLDMGKEGNNDYHHSAVGITRLHDGTFLLAACVEEYCKTIRFYKSVTTSLHTDPRFLEIDEWRYDSNPVPDNWEACGHNNLNLVVQEDGGIFLVLFGGEYKGTPLNACGTGGGDDNINVFKLYLTETRKVLLESKIKVRVETGDACDIVNPSTGTNFDAGGGLWISPDGKDDIAILATEHYDSCGSPGKSRWGVTHNWDD